VIVVVGRRAGEEKQARGPCGLIVTLDVARSRDEISHSLLAKVAAL
jgi:hypothetical protein